MGRIWVWELNLWFRFRGCECWKKNGTVILYCTASITQKKIVDFGPSATNQFTAEYKRQEEQFSIAGWTNRRKLCKGKIYTTLESDSACVRVCVCQ